MGREVAAQDGGWLGRLRRWLRRDSAEEGLEGGSAEERLKGDRVEPDSAAERLDAARRRLKETIEPMEDEDAAQVDDQGPGGSRAGP